VVIRNYEGKVFEYPEAVDGVPLELGADGEERECVCGIGD